jgi:hypothetical protein
LHPAGLLDMSSQLKAVLSRLLWVADSTDHRNALGSKRVIGMAFVARSLLVDDGALGAAMSATELDPLKKLLIYAMTDAFNRSISALEAAGAFSLKKMRSEYKGVGSRYYDVVTEAMLQTIAQHQPTFEEFFSTQSKTSSAD